MGTEIERKFLVKSYDWQSLVVRKAVIRQKGLLRDPNGATGRVRLISWDARQPDEPVVSRALVTLKGPPSEDNLSRPEYEWEVPFETGLAMYQSWPGPGIDKTRHEVEVDGRTWEVDVFHGMNEGLVVAEIEFPSRDEAVGLTVLPAWVGMEVTSDKRYSNSLLEVNPWPNWSRFR